MLKGETVEVGKLERYVPVAFLEEELPAVEIRGYTYPQLPQKLPRFAIATGYYNCGTKRQVTFRPFERGTGLGEARSLYFPKEYALRKLTGTAGQRIQAEWQKTAAKNLHAHIGFLNLGFGSDPEIFVEDSKGELFPAFKFLPGKADGILHHGQGSGEGKVYWDGFQAETTTQHSACLAWMIDSVQRGMAIILQEARKKDAGAKLTLRNVFEMPPATLNAAKDEHVALGCLPSLNAYGLHGQAMTDGRQLPFRFAGGHAHFGVGTPAVSYEEMVRTLDAILGVACVSLFEKFDNPIRRQFYGLPGEYRLPKHGLEYRTLSNAWLCHPAIANLVFDTGRVALQLADSKLGSLWQAKQDETIAIIRDCDAAGARKVLRRNEGLLKSLWQYYYHYADSAIAEKAFDTFLYGPDSVVADPLDVEKNWDLAGGWQAHSDGYGKNWSRACMILKSGKKV